MTIEEKLESLRAAAEQFHKAIDEVGGKSFFYVHLDDLSRFWDCNFAPEDPAYHYLKQAMDIDYVFKKEKDRWKHTIIGTQQPFVVTCVNNIEIEQYLERGKTYVVVSALWATDGYCFVLTDEFGKFVKPPAGSSGFHSTRFELSKMIFSNN